MTAYWFLTRGSGLVTLVLLTLSLALGVANVRRVQSSRVPRFVVNAIHRNASLLAIVFLAVHIATVLLDGYVPIRLIDVVLPFGAGYRPVWVGLGAIAFDLLIAVAVTSMLRRHIGYRAWRATHWLAYACWPVALLHGLGTGSDAGTIWMRAVTGICVAIVIAAALTRLRPATDSERHVDRRRLAGDVDIVGERARDQQRRSVAPRADRRRKQPVAHRDALAGHQTPVPVRARV